MSKKDQLALSAHHYLEKGKFRVSIPPACDQGQHEEDPEKAYLEEKKRVVFFGYIWVLG